MARAKKKKVSFKGLEIYQDKRKFLKQNSESFLTSTTTYTAKMERTIDGIVHTEMYYQEQMSKKNFILSQMLKSQIRKNIGKLPPFENDRIKYCVYNYPRLIPNTTIENVVEVDINSAYVTTALNLGLIDRQLYDKLQSVDKIVRLKCLGSIATQNVVTEILDGKSHRVYVKTDESLRRAWFSIVRVIDNILLSFAEKYDEFLFYYVDGIYVIGNSIADEIVSSLTQLKYESKVQVGMTIQVGSLGDLLVTDDQGDERIFFTRRSEFRKWANI